MLVLSRREGDEVVITTPEGRRIVVVVDRVGDCLVRLGFAADREVSINRREVQDRIDAGRAAGGE